MDTIYALASGPGRAGISVVRISGPRAFQVIECLCGTVPEPRRAALRNVRGKVGEIDQALVIAFEDGRSFTGEQSAELHLHGSPAIVSAVFNELSVLDGLRVAEPGEFTRRALNNEKLDLTQVEGLSDLIAAETETQRKLAMRVFSGAFSELVDEWRGALLRALAFLEASIDFSDEELPNDLEILVRREIQQVVTSMDRELEGLHAAQRVQDGFEVAILGPTNAGKSTLLNHIAGRDLALTSEVAGTTRDVIEARVDLGGLAVTFLDTAGIRETSDNVEALGIGRALDRARRAHLRIFLDDGSGIEAPISMTVFDIRVIGKADSNPAGEISGITGYGVDELLRRVANHFALDAAPAGLATRERHRVSMMKCKDYLRSAERCLTDGVGIEIAAHELRNAVSSVEALVGHVGNEEILGEIFAEFCLGK